MDDILGYNNMINYFMRLWELLVGIRFSSCFYKIKFKKYYNLNCFNNSSPFNNHILRVSVFFNWSRNFYLANFNIFRFCTDSILEIGGGASWKLILMLASCDEHGK